MLASLTTPSFRICQVHTQIPKLVIRKIRSSGKIDQNIHVTRSFRICPIPESENSELEKLGVMKK